MVLILKILLFTVLVPGTVAGYIPWSLVRDIPFVLTPWSIPAALYCGFLARNTRLTDHGSVVGSPGLAVRRP